MKHETKQRQKWLLLTVGSISLIVLLLLGSIQALSSHYRPPKGNDVPVGIDVGTLYQRSDQYEGKTISCWITVSEAPPRLVNGSTYLEERDFNITFVFKGDLTEAIAPFDLLTIRGISFLLSKGVVQVIEWQPHPAGKFLDSFASVIGFVMACGIMISSNDQYRSIALKYLRRSFRA